MTRYPASCNEDLAVRVYSSRLIGRESSLVLHGGGNTSVKTTLVDDLDADVHVLCVKGSGWDLESIDVEGLPAVRLESFRALRKRADLSDKDMVNAARTRLLDASAPNPSVEALLHAFLPHCFIDHSHADSILALVDQPDAERLCRDIFGDRLAIVPYVMPGFALAKQASECHDANPDADGLLLMHHGLVTYGPTARASYEVHIELVTRAEEYLAARRCTVAVSPRSMSAPRYEVVAPLIRGALNERHVLTLRNREELREFVDDPEVESLAGRGPVTPDHVIRTKRLPMILDLDGIDESKWRGAIEKKVEDFRREYRAYFSRQTDDKGVEKVMLDPDPRIVLLPGLGVLGLGRDVRAAGAAADLYEHTVSVIRDAEAAGRYQSLPEADIFDMEYWSLEQAKLGRRNTRELDGWIVFVTGAGSGIGEATARRFARAGACLYLVDKHRERVEAVAEELGCVPDAVDVTHAGALHASIQRCVRTYGGLDGVVSNAGIAPQARMDECPPELLQGSLDVNLIAHQTVAAHASRIMRTQGKGGFLLFNASKAAFNPGEGFGPYAVAKAALVALMKQYALEGGDAGIRSNAINADRVRTRLLPPEVVESRARARGLDAEDYFRSNLLQTIVTADDVAEGFLNLALARSTTGAVLTVDGGNIAASPR